MTTSSVPDTTVPADNATVDPVLREQGRRKLGARGLLLLAVVGFVALALTRLLTGADDLTSGGTVAAAIAAAVPIGLAGLGGLWSERAGVVNIGLEGMMILGTFFGAYFALKGDSAWMMLLGGVVGGLIGGVVHALATVTFGVDQIVSGVAINIAALGAARFLAGVFFAGIPGGGATQSPQVPTFDSLAIPGAGSFLGDVDRHNWFLVSDVAGVLDGLATGLTAFTIISILLLPLTWFVLWRTSFGLRLRSCGEKPIAAESLGVNVYLMKWIAVLTSGALAGLAGGFLVQLNSIYREGQTGGRGYIGLAAMIFGNWRPGGLAVGSGLFGYTDALRLRSGNVSVHALLVFAAMAVFGAAFVAWRNRRVRDGLIALGVAALIALWYLATSTLPAELVTYTPQFVTLVVLAFASQRLRPPAADGLPWRKGQRE